MVTYISQNIILSSEKKDCRPAKQAPKLNYINNLSYYNRRVDEITPGASDADSGKNFVCVSRQKQSSQIILQHRSKQSDAAESATTSQAFYYNSHRSKRVL